MSNPYREQQMKIRMELDQGEIEAACKRYLEENYGYGQVKPAEGKIITSYDRDKELYIITYVAEAEEFVR
jgi:hypothetical protein